MAEMKGKKCLITGASRGVGEGIALAYAKHQAVLFLAARSGDTLRTLAERCKAAGAPQVEVFEVDFSKSSAVQALADKIISTHGGVDVLVNNAGALCRDTPLDGSPDEWEKMFAVNVHAPMRLTRMLAPKMVKEGSGVIINICSISGLQGFEPEKMNSAYAATKYALRGWTYSCFEQFRSSNVKVMAIHPGLIDTPMTADVVNHDAKKMLKVSDIAEVAMLPFRTSAACCPMEITLRQTQLLQSK